MNVRMSPSNKQLTRILIVLGIVLLLAIVGFGGYYWYDRYYRPQPTVADASVQKAEEAVASDPQSLEKRLALADAYMTSGRWDDAIARANEVLAVEPEGPRDAARVADHRRIQRHTGQVQRCH